MIFKFFEFRLYIYMNIYLFIFLQCDMKALAFRISSFCSWFVTVISINLHQLT